jgi:hypothetical protein
MTDLNLTPEERDVVDAWARDRHGVGSRLGFYGSILVPLLLFAAYGIERRELPALVVALIGLLIFLGWHLSREFSRLGAYKSLFRKIVEHERGPSART